MNVLEVVYYISFIILTALIVYYAYKTYQLQSKKSFQLLCKINVLKETFGSFHFRYALEVYNHGNEVAEKIKVIVNGQDITTIDFIKPNESFMFPLGDVTEVISGNCVYPDYERELVQGTPVDVQLICAGTPYNYQVNTDLLYAYHGVGNGTLSEVANAIESIKLK